MINTISAKEALRLLNYWQNTKWEIEKLERELVKIKEQYLNTENVYETIYTHICYCPLEELTIQDYCEAMDGAQEHLEIFHKDKDKSVLNQWLQDARVINTEKFEYEPLYGEKVKQVWINISILKPKDQENHNKEIKDLENHIDNLKEKYNNILEELKRFNIVT
jgi:molecular chaperone GrpE (heat shock protein)